MFLERILVRESKLHNKPSQMDTVDGTFACAASASVRAVWNAT